MKRILMVCLAGMVFIVTAATETPPPQRGFATWYETNSNEMRASHAKLPFGTRIQVTNLENNKQVVVTISNRIPANEELVLAIAPRPAATLAMSQQGKTPILLEVIRTKRPRPIHDEPPRR